MYTVVSQYVSCIGVMKPSHITDFEAWESIFNKKLFGSKNFEIQIIEIQNSLKEHIKPDSLFVIQYSDCLEAQIH